MKKRPAAHSETATRRSNASAALVPVVAAALVVTANAAQDSAPAVVVPPSVPVIATTQSTQSPRIRFNFKGQTYDQILDYFSRVTGYPVVREVEAPKGTVDYIYPKDYSLDEALQTLNAELHAARRERTHVLAEAR